MIDAGRIDYALVVDGEGARHTHEVTLDRLARPDATREDVLAQFATLTLGSGAAAMVLGRADAHPGGPPARRRRHAGRDRAPRAVHRRPRVHADRRQGPPRRGHGALATACGDDAKAEFDWSDMDRYIAHQVSQAHTSAMCRTVGIDPARVPLTFPTRGNMGPATIPFTLATQLDSLRPGRPGAAHGRRVRHERRLHGNGLVSAARPRRSTPPDGLPGLDPSWSRLVTATDTDGVEPHLARARQRGRGRPRHDAVRARQPDVVLPVAAVPRRGARGLAGGGRRPARHGVLRAPRRAPRTLAHRVGRPHRRDRRARRDRPGRDGRARLGRRDLARLGAGPPRPAPRRRAGQHGGAPARRRGRAVADPAGPHPGAAARGLHGHADVRPRHQRPVPPALPATSATRSPRPTARRPGGAPSGSSSPTSRSSPSTSARRRWTASPRVCRRWPTCRCCCCGGPRDPVFSDRYLRDLRARLPHARRPPLRAGLAPRDRGRSATARSTPGAGWRSRDAGPARRATPRGPCRPAAGLGRAGGPRAATRPPAVVELADGRRTISFDLLERRVRELAAGLAATGVRAGDRVALLVPPGADLTAAAYACWRAGRGRRARRRGARPARPGARPARRGPRPRHRRRARARAGPAAAASRAVGSSRAARAGRCAACSARQSAWPTSPAPAAGSRPPPRRRRRTPRPRCCSPPARPGPRRAWSTGTASCRPSSTPCAPPTGSPPTTGSSRRSRRSRSTGPRWASPPPCPTARAPGTSPPPRSPTPPRPWTRPSSSPRPPPCATSWRPSTGSTRPTARRWPGSAWSSPRGRRCPRRCCTRWAPSCPRAAFHTPYGMTEALPVTDVVARRDRRRRAGRRRLRRASPARGRPCGSARCRRRGPPTAR